MHKFLWYLCKHITSSHVVDLPTGMIVWECRKEGLVCICPFSPSVCIHALEAGGGQDGFLALTPCASASAVAGRNRQNVSHQQREAETAELMCQWCPGLSCGSWRGWHTPGQTSAPWLGKARSCTSHQFFQLLRIHGQGLEVLSQSDNDCPEHINVM